MLDIKEDILSPRTLQYSNKFNDLSLGQIEDFSEMDMICQFISALRGKSSDFHQQKYELESLDFDRKLFTVIAENGLFQDIVPPRIMSQGSQLVLTFGDFLFPIEVKTDGENYANLICGNLVGNLHEEVKETLTKEKYSLFYILFDEKVAIGKNKPETIESWLIRLAFKKEKNEFISFKKSELVQSLFDGTFSQKLKEVGEKSSQFKSTVPLRCLEIGCHQLQSYRKVELPNRVSWVLDFGYPVDFWANAQINDLLNSAEVSNAKLATAKGAIAQRCKPISYEGSWLDVTSKEVKGDNTFVNATLLRQGLLPKSFLTPANGGIDPFYLQGYSQQPALPAVAELITDDDISF